MIVSGYEKNPLLSPCQIINVCTAHCVTSMTYLPVTAVYEVFYGNGLCKLQAFVGTSQSFIVLSGMFIYMYSTHTKLFLHAYHSTS